MRKARNKSYMFLAIALAVVLFLPIQAMLLPAKLPHFNPIRSKVADKPALIKLAKQGQGFCSGFVISDVYAITANHCVELEDGKLDHSTISIMIGEIDTGITAEAVAGQAKMDYAILKGDFAEFEHLGLQPTTNAFLRADVSDRQYVLCGYPLNSARGICRGYYPMQPYGFGVIGRSFAFPGDSGGVVIIADTGEAVAVVQGVDMDGRVVVGPTFGILTALGIESDE